MNGTQRLLTVCASHSPGMARDEKRVQGAVFREGLAAARDHIERFDPELVVAFGSDHRRTFTSVTPAVCVIAGATGLGDFGSAAGEYRVPGSLAEDLAGGLLEGGFDVAVARGVELDHGFGQTIGDLFGALDRYPIVPVYINCATPPLAPVVRAAAIGRALRSLLPGDRRVLALGSGGLSHSPPSLRQPLGRLTDEERRRLNTEGFAEAQRWISPEWDARFLAALERNDQAWLEGLTESDIAPAGVGAHEVRTWVAAQALGDHELATLAYEPVPDWITGVGVAVSAWAAASAPGAPR